MCYCPALRMHWGLGVMSIRIKIPLKIKMISRIRADTRLKRNFPYMKLLWNFVLKSWISIWEEIFRKSVF